MKISNTFIVSYATLICVFVLLLNLYKIGNLDDQLQYGQFIIDVSNIIFPLIIYRNINNNSRLFIIFPIAITLLFIMDVHYRIIFYLQESSYLLQEIIMFSWDVITMVGLLLPLMMFVYGRKERILIFASFLLVAFAMLFFFAPNYIRYLDYPYYSIDLSIHLTIFYCCILLIVSIKNKHILLSVCGLCIGEIGQFSITECHLLGYENYKVWLVYGELFWFVGILMLSIGMINIIKYKLYNPREWFINSESIRNKLAFLIFHISLWSFIIACFSITKTNNISNASLSVLPVIGMAYSMVAAILSFIIGNIIEKPFLLFKNNMTSVFADRKLATDNGLDLIEFKELQDFFLESYEYKNYIQKQVVSLATRVAHDIKSPTLILENIIKNWEEHNLETIKYQIAKQINKISYISRSMLKENKDFEDRSYGAQCMYTIAKDIISDKQIEWTDDNKIIDFYYIPNKVIWISDEQAEVKRVLSNILNNAYEARIEKQDNINFIIEMSESNLIIKIQDFGCGIPTEEIKSILSGKSLKPYGNGIGLSSAKKFLESIKGNITIDSTVDQGTTVNISMPIQSFPAQYPNEIIISMPRAIILDDDQNIIKKWQGFFLRAEENIDVNYFVRFSALSEYLESHTRDDVTYLLDYKVFGENKNGVDIIKEFKLNDVYLITNYAEDEKLQEEIKSLPIKLIPKGMLDADIITIGSVAIVVSE